MQLGQAKARLFALMDETEPDSALRGRLDHFFDIGQREICLYYPIYRRRTTPWRTPAPCRRTALPRCS